MVTNIKVENFYNKHRSNIILAAHTQTSLESILRDLFQEMYDLGHADGSAKARGEFNRLEEENGNYNPVHKKYEEIPNMLDNIKDIIYEEYGDTGEDLDHVSKKINNKIMELIANWL